ncbi:uncharacterized protein LOC131221505 isoform X2 [Magnolia sinica]|uniref:uncharacterized protein LOC131221505 isoform X2 n=1 Tax=Magnolia sinica TaxID=86752 RepID=UPI00265A5598|nr:uncharacterized protein LOC131221505 isoform X2 [Magnolia sinica]
MPETFSMSESSKAEAWVNHMIGSTTDESVEVEFEGCPSRTGMVWQCNWREEASTSTEHGRTRSCKFSKMEEDTSSNLL